MLKKNIQEYSKMHIILKLKKKFFLSMSKHFILTYSKM